VKITFGQLMKQKQLQPIVQTAEVIEAYAHRADVPASAWWQLLLQAQNQIDFLGYAMLFLPEQHPRLIDLLKEKSRNGSDLTFLIN